MIFYRQVSHQHTLDATDALQLRMAEPRAGRDDVAHAEASSALLPLLPLSLTLTPAPAPAPCSRPGHVAHLPQRVLALVLPVHEVRHIRDGVVQMQQLRRVTQGATRKQTQSRAVTRIQIPIYTHTTVTIIHT